MIDTFRYSFKSVNDVWANTDDETGNFNESIAGRMDHIVKKTTKWWLSTHQMTRKENQHK